MRKSKRGIFLKITKSFLALLFLINNLNACGNGIQNGKTINILDAQEKVIAHFEVEIADSPQEISQGLMYRQELDQDRGMLFIFNELNETPFWMKNTLIPLDIIFIGADKKIISIIQSATPQTTTPRYAEAPYLYVLEINGGLSQELGISPGQQLEF
ncbi:MAG: DUF192 domain-containing protein [Deltaproteobacteria bacterium]|nr:DUF192 domain-containing protein [Deltaproteobacteria bacterium]